MIDGYLRPGTRFEVPILVVLATTPIALFFAVRRPLLTGALALLGAGAAGTLAYAFGARREDSITLAKWSIPFGVSYLAGMWRGAYLRACRTNGHVLGRFGGSRR